MFLPSILILYLRGFLIVLNRFSNFKTFFILIFILHNKYIHNSCLCSKLWLSTAADKAFFFFFFFSDWHYSFSSNLALGTYKTCPMQLCNQSITRNNLNELNSSMGRLFLILLWSMNAHSYKVNACSTFLPCGQCHSTLTSDFALYWN